MATRGVSPLVDSCAGLIHQKAFRTFRRISPENKRWIDLEDVIQDGIIEAWEASQRYDKTKGTRFSTYLYRGIDMSLSARYAIPLRQKKRVTTLTELDAPIPGTDMMPEVETSEASPEQLFQAVSGLVCVCSIIPPVAVSFLLGVIVSESGLIRRRTADDIACIPEACRELGVLRQDIDLVMASAHARGLVLEGVVRSSVVAEEDIKVLECIECRIKFSLSDVRQGLYSATSLTCSVCLKKISAAGAENTCFGRKKELHNNRTVTEGYSEADAECRLHCRDRAACVRFIQVKEKRMAKKVPDMDVELEDVDFTDVEAEDTDTATTDDAEAEAPAKSTKKAAKSAGKKSAAKKATKAPAKETKPAKSAAKKVAKAPAKSAAKKAAKSDKSKGTRTPKSSEPIDPKVALKEGLIKLDEHGRDLPFKAGSMMRWCLEQALEPGGVTEKEMEAKVIKLGYDYKFQRTVLLSGKSGDSSLRPYPSTHTWKAEATGEGKDARITVSNVKRIAFYKRMARIDGR